MLRKLAGSAVRLGLYLILLLLVGCSSKEPQRTQVPRPPSPEVPTETSDLSSVALEPTPPKFAIPEDAPVLYTEIGLASWYGVPYHNRRSSSGEIYNMHGFTAAHRTLPLNSFVRVTNVRTGRQTLVRITDRGPFIPGRVIDLSLAAARQTDVWRAGVAKVKLEAIAIPKPLDSGGRWCVQIGALKNEKRAKKLREKLARRYQTADVIHFAGPTGYWVRVRVLDDDRERAEEVARENGTPDGAVFLVRLD